MEPTNKLEKLEAALSDFLGVKDGRLKSIRQNVCIPKPIGCGEPIGEFKDEISKREYLISGLCQKCQDKIFC